MEIIGGVMDAIGGLMEAIMTLFIWYVWYEVVVWLVERFRTD